MLVQDTRDMTLEDYVRKSDSVAAMPDGAAKKEAFAALSAQAGPWATKRLFIGKYDRTKAAVLEIMDRKGNSRLVLGVDSLGTPSIDFLNEKGDITYHLSDAGTNKTKK